MFSERLNVKKRACANLPFFFSKQVFFVRVVEEYGPWPVLRGDGAGAALDRKSDDEVFSIADCLARSDHRCAGAGSAGIDPN